MATTYKDADIQCPFYKGQGKQSISCEGIVDDSLIKQWFKFPKSKSLHMKVFCQEKYKNCEIYEMLEKKYED